jgi:hypothetical protein
MTYLQDIQLTSANIGGTTTVTQIGNGGTDTTTNQTGGNTIVSSNIHTAINVIGGGGGASGGRDVSSVDPFVRGFPAGGRTTGDATTDGTNASSKLYASDTVNTGTSGGGAPYTFFQTSIGNYICGQSAITTIKSGNNDLGNVVWNFVLPTSIEMANGSFRYKATGTGRYNSAGQGGLGGSYVNNYFAEGSQGTVPMDTDARDTYDDGQSFKGFSIEYYNYYKHVISESMPDPEYRTPYAPFIGAGGQPGGAVGINTPADTTSGYGAGGDASYGGKAGAVIISYQDYTYTGNWDVNK